MTPTRFDRIAIVVGQRATRRTALGLLAALGITGLGRAKAAPAATCTLKANGVRCTTGTECCSGRCVRKRNTHKKFCRQAPGQGICTTASNSCSNNLASICDAAGNSTCVCYVTTRGSSFCGATGNCFNCQTDADCVKRPGTGKRGDRCVEGADCCAVTNHRACIHRCKTPAKP